VTLKPPDRPSDPGAGGAMPAPRKSARLVIQNGGFEGMTFELSAEETLIGRNPTTDITLLDDGISREHAIILYDPDSDSYSLEDLQSTNGTQVNGKRVRSVTLADGDEVRVGRTLFRFSR
jgi:pSer/pThr/pTyr-binding forkhead associated (FHA) protein